MQNWKSEQELFYQACTKHFTFLTTKHNLQCKQRGLFYYELSVCYTNDILDITVYFDVNYFSVHIALCDKIAKRTAGLYFLYEHLSLEQDEFIDNTSSISDSCHLLKLYADFLDNYWDQILAVDWKKYGRMSPERYKKVQETFYREIDGRIKQNDLTNTEEKES